MVVLERIRDTWTVRSASASITEVAGWAPAALAGRDWPPFWRTGEELERELRAALDAGRQVAVDGHVMRPDGGASPAAVELVPLVGGRQALCLLAPVAAPAYEDALTGLANRALLERDLGVALSRASRHGHAVAVLFIDLDRFKPVNDRYGHAAGDVVLREVAHRLRAIVRAHDLLVRLGGDEFVVVLTDLDGAARERAEAVAAHVREAMREPIVLEPASVVVHASVGVAIFPDEVQREQELLAAADAGMYRAKRARPALEEEVRDGLIARARRAEEHAQALQDSTAATMEAARVAVEGRRKG